jgi:hypothetical protein
MTPPRLLTRASRTTAVAKALRLLEQIAATPSVFADYGGHLLLAFWLIGTTSRCKTLRQSALGIGRERARYWRAQWPSVRRNLHADNVLQEVIASYAATGLGIVSDSIRCDLRSATATWSPRDLVYYDPATEYAPSDVPEHCCCGRANARKRSRCSDCRRRLDSCSRYEIWYYALTSAYFSERHQIPLGVTFLDVLRELPDLRPLPSPGMDDYYQGIYAVTHLVYTLTDYGRWLLSPRLFPTEYRFLRDGMDWALEQQEADTVGEIVDTLATFGASNSDPVVGRGRTFLLQTQQSDGGWGKEGGDPYAYFHTVWTGIDGLRENCRRRYRSLSPAILSAIESHGEFHSMRSASFAARTSP